MLLPEMIKSLTSSGIDIAKGSGVTGVLKLMIHSFLVVKFWLLRINLFYSWESSMAVLIL